MYTKIDQIKNEGGIAKPSYTLRPYLEHSIVSSKVLLISEKIPLKIKNLVKLLVLKT